MSGCLCDGLLYSKDPTRRLGVLAGGTGMGCGVHHWPSVGIGCDPTTSALRSEWVGMFNIGLPLKWVASFPIVALLLD